MKKLLAIAVLLYFPLNALSFGAGQLANGTNTTQANASAAKAAPVQHGPQDAEKSLLVGNWLGTLNISITDLRLALTLRLQPDGSLVGTLNSLDQDAVDRPLDEVSIHQRTVRLALKKFGLQFEGSLSADGKQIAGTFKQTGNALPLTFQKLAGGPEKRRRPQEPKPPFPYKTELVTFENRPAHARFAGTLTLPAAGTKHPAVVLITGSGQQDRDEAIAGHRPFFVIADHLTRHGIAVLRVDDRGVGGSTGDVWHATSEDFAGDVLAAVAYLKGRSEFDPQKIGLVGHSEGGLIAPMAATRSHDVAFIVLLAGPGLPGDQIIFSQSAIIARQMGASAPTLVVNRVVQEVLFAAIKRGKDPATMMQNLKPRAKDDDTRPHKYEKKENGNDKKQKTVQAPADVDPASTLSSPWFRFFLTYDPRPTLKQVRCPVLALGGEKDAQVPPKENLPEIEKALRAGGNPDFTVRELPKLNHLFQTSSTGGISEYSRIEETFAPSALEIMTDWIRQHTK